LYLQRFLSQMWKKIWIDPVWSKVIASAILVTAGIILAYLKGWWQLFSHFVQRFISFLFTTTPIPIWLLGVFSLSLFLVLIVAGSMIRRILFPSQDTPSFRSYVEDSFFNIKWRWRYDSSGGVFDLFSFCPHCDYQVHAENISNLRIVKHIGYYCDDCNRRLGDFEMSQQELKSRVIRQIHKNIRNKKWISRQNT
jgi:hypothetical protein